MGEDPTAANVRTDSVRRLIVALDVSSADSALNLAERLHSRAGLFKIGLELFTSEGPPLIRKFVERGAGVFLDLKLHDIPNTVRGAARSAARLGARMITIHISGGAAMMQAALEGAREGAAAGNAPLVLGVTVLTSLSNHDLAALGWNGTAETAARRLAGMAQTAGLRGVVASPQEAAAIRQSCGPNFVIVTPGIRPAHSALDDQARAATPGAAVRAGADFLVVGRPVTQAPDPAAAAAAITDEIALALSNPSPEASARGRG